MNRAKVILVSVIFALTIIFFATWANKGSDTHKFLDAAVVFFAAIASVVVGFGVLYSRRDQKIFEAHFLAMNNSFSCSHFDGVANAMRSYAATLVPQGQPIDANLELFSQKLNEIGKNVEAGNLEIQAVINHQIEMAKDATIWYEIGSAFALAAALAAALLMPFIHA